MSTCHLFRQELHLISADKCLDVSENDFHVCLKPGKSIPTPAENDKCVQCLTGSASVLHVQRSDGSICVAGLATPTTKVCESSDKPVSFTIIEKVLPNWIENSMYLSSNGQTKWTYRMDDLTRNMYKNSRFNWGFSGLFPNLFCKCYISLFIDIPVKIQN